MSVKQLLTELDKGDWDSILETLYKSDIEGQRSRYASLLHKYSEIFGEGDVRFFSSPGRTEIGGNHTDHNFGRVLAAGVDLDTLAAAAATDDGIITIHSEGYPEIKLEISDLEVRADEKESTPAVVRGFARGLKDRNYKIGGFNAVVTSRVLRGSGLSSSASFEVLVGVIFNGLYNEGKVGSTEIAQIGQFAENVFYGKPSGLMDQMACSHNGLLSIDFADPEDPVMERLAVSFESLGYRLMVVNTHGDHADLSSHYASMPLEMKAVAALFGQEVLRGLTLNDIVGKADQIRKELGDRAFLRAYHFILENDRVSDQLHALEKGEIKNFVVMMNASGRSSFQYLQNLYVGETPEVQAMSVGIAMAESLLEGEGAVRVHGGGFAGTILALVPLMRTESFTTGMDSFFGSGSVQPLTIRNNPAGEVGKEVQIEED